MHKQPPTSYAQSIIYYLKAYLAKATLTWITYSQKLPPDQQPQIIRYPYNKSLPCRLFVPSSVKSESRNTPYLISIHGGGWTVCGPDSDDNDNRLLSEHFGFVVLAINYRKAPAYPFPSAVYDCAALIEAALQDADLPVDKSKIAVVGYSAGGNLALASLQLNGLASRVKAVVAYYPVTDLVRSPETKLQSTKIAPWLDVDPLAGLLPFLNWSYVPPGTNLEDPLLSPIFCERQLLPRKIFIMSCEYDVLSDEARRMALHLTGGVDTDAIGEERWSRDGITWKLLRDVGHAFNSIAENDVIKEKERWAKVVSMHDDTAQWLIREAFRSG
jgi:acetyl esterase/lipase